METVKELEEAIKELEVGGASLAPSSLQAAASWPLPQPSLPGQGGAVICFNWTHSSDHVMTCRTRLSPTRPL